MKRMILGIKNVMSAVLCLTSVSALGQMSGPPKRRDSRARPKLAHHMAPPPFFPFIPPDVFFPPPNIKVPAQEESVQLQSMDLKVHVSGLETETTTTLTFYNPNGRVLEGNLEFPLGSDATVTGYALDIHGVMVDGVIVSKEKARVVLETEIRRGVDPGIVEHMQGNMFRTRIYPIPARGSRTVKITTVAPLILVKEDAAMHIPLPQGEKIAKLNIEVTVDKGAVHPQIGGFGNLSFTDWNNSWSAKASLSNVSPDNDLFVNLPKIPNQLTKVEDFDGEFFVGISDLPSSSAKGEAFLPKHVDIAWDASGSRKPQSVAKDREFLKSLIATWKQVEIDLHVFRNQLEKPAHFVIQKGDATELLKLLDGLPYDGGTNLTLLDLASHKTEGWLLFTDGLNTIGESLPKFGGSPVTVVNSDSARDLGLQRFLAGATGGTVVDLTVMNAAQAVEHTVHPGLRLLRVDAPAGALQEVQTRFDPSGGRATVYGKLMQDTTATLVYGVGGKEIMKTQITLTKKSAQKNHILARAWATAKAIELGVFAEKNQPQLLALGQRYNVVTPGTSLIVLESVAQYLEHDITPPDSMPQWKQEYQASFKQMQNRRFTAEKTKIEQVVSWWDARVKWFDEKFVYDKNFKYRGTAEGKGASSSIGGFGGAAPPPAAAEPQGAPVDDAASYESSDGDFADRAAAPASPNRMRESSAKKDKTGGAGGSDDATITINGWNPATPYMDALQKAPADRAYAVYLQQVPAYKSSPGFFLDCTNFFMKRDRVLALRVLSNLAELNLENPALLRVFAWRLSEAGELDAAIQIMEKVRRIRPEEPQSHRDLALLLAAKMDRDHVLADGEKAAELFYKVITTDWPHAQEIEVIVVMELNHLLAAMDKIDSKASKKLTYIDARLKKLMDLDVRITMTWDADQTDMDLHVIEPSGEEAYYAHNKTTIGGIVSKDITQGYGPEEYVIRRAMPGKYKIRCNYYGSHQQTLLGPVTVSATVYTNYGRPNEKRQLLTLRLDKQKDTVDIGEIAFGGEGGSTPDAQIHAVPRSTLSKLKKGMSEADVVKIMGEPSRRDGSGLSILVYFLNDGTQVRLGIGSGLIYAHEVHDGAELNLPL